MLVIRYFYFIDQKKNNSKIHPQVTGSATVGSTAASVSRVEKPLSQILWNLKYNDLSSHHLRPVMSAGPILGHWAPQSMPCEAQGLSRDPQSRVTLPGSKPLALGQRRSHRQQPLSGSVNFKQHLGGTGSLCGMDSRAPEPLSSLGLSLSLSHTHTHTHTYILSEVS